MELVVRYVNMIAASWALIFILATVVIFGGTIACILRMEKEDHDGVSK